MSDQKKKPASKPSERIRELAGSQDALFRNQTHEHTRIDAIIQYLDERWERSQQRGKNRNKIDK